MAGVLAVGDLVVRKSHGADVVFRVSSIEDGVALLRGVCFRLMADAPISDLVKIEADLKVSAPASLGGLEMKIG